MNIKRKFENERILVLGDVMLDRFWWGEVSRISPEAPVPVVRLERTTEALGGAANVAANIAGLGSTPIVVGCVGDDADGKAISKLLLADNIDVSSIATVEGRPTTVKTRVIARGQHVVRVDREISTLIGSSTESTIREQIAKFIQTVKCVVISDYAKGFFTDELLRFIISRAGESDIPVLVDPKSADLGRYLGSSIITPNKREAAVACGLPIESDRLVIAAGSQLLEILHGTSILITEGEDGMTLFEPDSDPFHVDTVAREVFDVTGAGDTVIASLAVATVNGYSLQEAVQFANLAAGIAVEHTGTTRVTWEMLDRSLHSEASRSA